MPCNHRSGQGYSLIELLVVLAIVGVLAMVGTSMLVGNRSSAATRTLLDELEGTLMAAQKRAMATGQDVTLATQGDWVATNPLILAMSTTAGLAPSDVVAQGLTDPASFKLGLVYNHGTPTGLVAEHAYAGIVTAANQGWWTTAAEAWQGRQNQDPATVEPFKDQAGFAGILAVQAQNFFQGGSAASGPLQISGTTKRFNSTLWIEVVGLRGGAPYPGAPMGLLVVEGNGGTVYKFYNPGVVAGDGLWRRL